MLNPLVALKTSEESNALIAEEVYEIPVYRSRHGGAYIAALQPAWDATGLPVTTFVPLPDYTGDEQLARAAFQHVATIAGYKLSDYHLASDQRARQAEFLDLDRAAVDAGSFAIWSVKAGRIIAAADKKALAWASGALYIARYELVGPDYD